jgi:transposase
MPIPLRGDYDAEMVRAAAKRSKDGPQARRLLALAAVYEGATRTEAAKIGGVTLQIIRDWVMKFNAHGPEGLIDRKAPGQPPRLNEAHRAALAAIIEGGPVPAVHGVVRWRIVDLCQWIFEEFRVVVAKQTLSRELRAMGYRKLSARPRHHAQAAGAIEDFKKAFPRAWKRSGARRTSARRTRSPGAGPSAARVQALPKISEPPRLISSARSVPRTAKARPWSCHAATRRR